MRILVIEDDPVLHHILSKRLKEEGHSVDDCYDGEAGFDYADAMQYDCIVLDLMLPKRDGSPSSAICGAGETPPRCSS